MNLKRGDILKMTAGNPAAQRAVAAQLFPPGSTGPDGAIRITMPLPPKQLSPNGRFHWAVKDKARKKYRERAHWTAFLCKPAQPWVAATLQLHFYFRDARRRDRDNFSSSMKAARDGLADAGIVANDSGITDLPVIMDVDRENPRVELTIREGGP